MEVVRKDIKNLHVGVYPSSGRVRVAAPLRLGDDAVRLAIISRLEWIRGRRVRLSHPPSSYPSKWSYPRLEGDFSIILLSPDMGTTR